MAQDSRYPRGPFVVSPSNHEWTSSHNITEAVDTHPVDCERNARKCVARPNPLHTRPGSLRRSNDTIVRHPAALLIEEETGRMTDVRSAKEYEQQGGEERTGDLF